MRALRAPMDNAPVLTIAVRAVDVHVVPNGLHQPSASTTKVEFLSTVWATDVREIDLNGRVCGSLE